MVTSKTGLQRDQQISQVHFSMSPFQVARQRNSYGLMSRFLHLCCSSFLEHWVTMVFLLWVLKTRVCIIWGSRLGRFISHKPICRVFLAPAAQLFIRRVHGNHSILRSLVEETMPMFGATTDGGYPKHLLQRLPTWIVDVSAGMDFVNMAISAVSVLHI